MQTQHPGTSEICLASPVCRWEEYRWWLNAGQADTLDHLSPYELQPSFLSKEQRILVSPNHGL